MQVTTEERINLAGIDTVADFKNYVEINNLMPDLYPKIKRDGTIIEFIYNTYGQIGMVIYNKMHSYYELAFQRAQVSENTYIEGI